MTNAFSLPAHSLLDTSGAVPQTGKPMMDFELPDSVLDTTGASPQTGKPQVGFELPASVLDTTGAAPQIGKNIRKA